MTLETDRSDLTSTRIVLDPFVELGEGRCRLRIDHFALTTNNITYGVFGDMLRYWDVFPAPDGASTWGRLPTWGFAEVVESRSDDVPVGERLFGFLPMSDETIITPGRVDDRGLSDIATHREGLAGAYNRYQRTSTDPTYHPDREFHQMVLFPLFFTSFVIDDFLLDNDDFGAQQLVISSASSKTAIGVARLARQRDLTTIGLTSPHNLTFVESLDIYSEVVTYDDLTTTPQRASAYIDIAGNQAVLFEIHTHLDGLLGHSMVVGNTNWNVLTESRGALPEPRPEFLFAPTQIAKRTKDWGRDELDRRIARAWEDFSNWSDSWIEFDVASGYDQVQSVYHVLVSGRPDPRVGYICSVPHEEEA